jgi:hypothetical protein
MRTPDAELPADLVVIGSEGLDDLQRRSGMPDATATRARESYWPCQAASHCGDHVAGTSEAL